MQSIPRPPRDESRRFENQQRKQYQLLRLNALLERILPSNEFYRDQLANVTLPLTDLDQLNQLPLTTKRQLEMAVAENQFANLTFPYEQYVRVHRTSGTSGNPLYVYDTPEDWLWWKEAWQYVLDAADVHPGDRALMAFSFGPFIGFWSANDALLHRDAMVIPTGGLSTMARLQMMHECQATLVCCTPTYALRMADVAEQEDFDLAGSSVTRLIVAGEPGGSLPEVRHRIESQWNARVIDHAGASEIGPWGYGDPEGEGLFVNEADFIAELLPHANNTTSDENDDAADPLFELVLTCLGRTGWPLIRYRTGDLVREGASPNADDCHLFLPGGILGRADDMLVIRGVNVFPSSIENVIRSVDGIHEFRATAHREHELDQLVVEVEADDESLAIRGAEALRRQLGLRIDVKLVAVGSLPRYEAKSKRFVDLRPADGA